MTMAHFLSSLSVFEQAVGAKILYLNYVTINEKIRQQTFLKYTLSPPYTYLYGLIYSLFL